MANRHFSVYNFSVLSNIPLSVADVLTSPSVTNRLRPLFNIGVHDIPFLIQDHEAAKKRSSAAIDDDRDLSGEAGTGWIACTTDSILAMKDTLWDMLITMPAPQAPGAKEKAWPTIECPRGVPVLATQRDLRRFRTLRAGLLRHSPRPESQRAATADSSASGASGFPLSPAMSNIFDEEADSESFDTIVEPVSWAALAYNGFMWWASAGEQVHNNDQEESSRDAALLADLSPSPHTPSMGTSPRPRDVSVSSMADSVSSLTARRLDSESSDPEEEARKELAIIAYFHRLTTQMLTVMAEAVEESSDEPYADQDDEGPSPRSGRAGDATEDSEGTGDEDVLLGSVQEGADEGAVRIPGLTFEMMGLDVWSRRDAEFVASLVKEYFGKSAYMEGKGVEVCGVRVC